MEKDMTHTEDSRYDATREIRAPHGTDPVGALRKY
jgi:hypothetical protein